MFNIYTPKLHDTYLQSRTTMTSKDIISVCLAAFVITI